MSITSLITHSVTAALAAVAAFGISTWIEYNDKERNYERQLDQDKLTIVDLISKNKSTIATILLDYYDKKFSGQDSAYSALIKGLQGTMDTMNVGISPPTQTPGFPQQNTSKSTGRITDLNPEYIQSQFFSAGRRDFAEGLVDLYRSASMADKNKLVDNLIASIIPGGSDPVRRYRVNIYIALTLGLLDKVNAEMHSKVLEALTSLSNSSEYKQDSQFQLNVSRALAKQS